MSFKVRINPILAIAIPVFYMLLELTLFKSAFSVPARVNGHFVLARSGSTVATALKMSGYLPLKGDLLDAKGQLLLTGGGTTPRLTANGKAVRGNARLAREDVIRFRQGRDVRLRAKKTFSMVPAPVQNIGAGRYLTVKKLGKPGKRERIVMAGGGVVISDKILVEPLPAVLVRSPRKPSKVAALTFDDGPDPPYTQAITRILRHYHVPGTFFVVGRNAQKHPEMLRLMRKLGYEVENHSFSHSRMDSFPPEAVAAELDATRDIILHARGRAPQWFRPPFAAYSGPIYDMLSQRGYGLALWNVDSEDWKAPNDQAIYDKVVSTMQPEAVILMHDGGGDRSKTVAALPRVIEYLQKQGYAFVSLDEMKRP